MIRLGPCRWLRGLGRRCDRWLRNWLLRHARHMAHVLTYRIEVIRRDLATFDRRARCELDELRITALVLARELDEFEAAFNPPPAVTGGITFGEPRPAGSGPTGGNTP